MNPRHSSSASGGKTNTRLHMCFVTIPKFHTHTRRHSHAHTIGWYPSPGPESISSILSRRTESATNAFTGLGGAALARASLLTHREERPRQTARQSPSRSVCRATRSHSSSIYLGAIVNLSNTKSHIKLYPRPVACSPPNHDAVTITSNY